LVSGESLAAWPGWVRRPRVPAARPGRPGRGAECRWLAARGGRASRVAAALGLGGRPRCVVVVEPAARVDGPRKGRWACRRRWACGPDAAQAGGGRSWLAAGSAVTCGNGWWACQDLNLEPHPETKIARVPTGSAAREPSLAGQARFSSLVAAPGHVGLISNPGLSAMRTAVSPGHHRASGAKLSAVSDGVGTVQTNHSMHLIPQLRYWVRAGPRLEPRGACGHGDRCHVPAVTVGTALSEPGRHHEPVQPRWRTAG